MKRLLLSVSILLFLSSSLTAQLTLSLERSGQDETEKRFRGDDLRFRLAGDDLWRQGMIQEIRPDINSLVINDRFVSVEEISELDLGSSRFVNAAGLSLQTFGVGWGFFALVGYALDGNPDTSISSGDITVAAGSFALGFIISKLNKRRFRVGSNRRLRIVDLNF